MSELSPIPDHFTHVVAERTFDLLRAAGTERLTVEIGAPVQDVETVAGMDWRCPIRIVRGVKAEVVSACGVDSFQALHLGIAVVRQKLEAVSAEPGVSLRMLGAPYDFANDFASLLAGPSVKR